MSRKQTNELIRQRLNNANAIALMHGLTKPQRKLMQDILKSLLKEPSQHLSTVARNINNNTTFENRENRVTHGLGSMDNDILQAIELAMVLDQLTDKDFHIIVDASTIEKRYAKNGLEGPYYTYDNAQHKTVFGYAKTTVLAATNDHIVFPLGQIIHEKKEGRLHKSEDTKQLLERVLDALVSAKKRPSYIVADTGYEGNDFMNFINNYGLFFIIRSKSNRNFIKDGVKHKFDEIPKFDFETVTTVREFQNRERVDFILKSVQVKLKDVAFDVNLVVADNQIETPMLLITNIPIQSVNDLEQIFYRYFKRWDIETFFQLVKEKYEIEKMLVQSILSMNNFLTLIFMTVNIVSSLIKRKSKTKEFIMRIKEHFKANETKFELFRAIDNISHLLSKRTQKSALI